MARAANADAMKALARDRREAVLLAQKRGAERTRKLLEEAAEDLERRIGKVTILKGLGAETFTVAHLRATLAQVREVTRALAVGMKEGLLDQVQDVAGEAVQITAKYLTEADKQFRGIGAQPLALNEARMFDVGTMGVRSSMLKRLASSGSPAAQDTEVNQPHKARLGILDRYGVETIGKFEKALQVGLVARKSWREMRDDLTEQSPFLQGAPAFWADRIVRTEVMGASNRAAWNGMREADKQLGDMVKILSATFDDRTGADSYAVHGQIRRIDEPFEWWDGAYMHPPNRPNDREVVIPHRISWPLPKELAWKSDAEVDAAWKKDGRKGAPPERPLMTTIPIGQFGKVEEPEKPEGEEEAEGKDVEETEEQAGKRRGMAQRDLFEAMGEPGEKFTPERGADVRQVVRKHLEDEYGLTSRDVDNADRLFNAMELSPDAEMPGAVGYHKWNGTIQLRESAYRDAHRALYYAVDDVPPMPGQIRALSAILHEEIHGCSPMLQQAYRGAEGVGMEEAATEILARAATRRLLKMPDELDDNDSMGLPKVEALGEGRKLAAGGSSMMSSAGRVYDHYIAGLLHAVGEIKEVGSTREIERVVEKALAETRSGKRDFPARIGKFEKSYATADDAIEDFTKTKALGLDEDQQKRLFKKLADHRYFSKYGERPLDVSKVKK
jgi:hypothetical protein